MAWLSQRLEQVNEKAIKLAGRIEGHEAVCAQRHAQIIRDLAEMRAYAAMISKVGLILAVMLFGIELGRATFPALFELIERVH